MTTAAKTVSGSAPVLYKVEALTPQEIAYLQSLAPAVAEHGVTITSTMYNYMFQTYPQVKSYFNQTNQYTKRQPQVLAFSLFQYISHLGDLTPLTAFVNQIVAKHCGLDVQAEQYTVVEKCLNHAFKSVLGNAADEQFFLVFGKAYGNLAQLLINAEWEYYKGLQWVGFKEFEVSRKESECGDVVSIYLSPKDGSQLPKPRPGQYVGLRWNIDGEENSREYLISQIPKSNEYRLSIRKIDGGIVSEFAHNELKVGDSLKVTAPVGNFIYDGVSPKDLVLFAGGIGITPLISIAEAGLKDGKKVTLLYSNRSAEHRPFGDWLEELKATYPEQFTYKEFLNNKGENLSANDIKSVATSEKDVYLLGPVEYMDFVKTELENNCVTDVKLEFFGPTKV
ncbi:uncharacterized protein KQ657_000534 [Scheffersomyces spartinae]|uniref:nitric oxide dioxygenase n=1 Tax=Scheffersomyces spartinae TaxID=45513 RepID=A0A9P8AHK8_9ASCO|nr:uncharacterized protein KQ657_000534 [Scheffersomyces spartinae]KAG7193467.1 hypothetical protein KQ657_000534 [Scheffersomyces spartinae]